MAMITIEHHRKPHVESQTHSGRMATRSDQDVFEPNNLGLHNEYLENQSSCESYGRFTAKREKEVTTGSELNGEEYLFEMILLVLKDVRPLWSDAVW